MPVPLHLLLVHQTRGQESGLFPICLAVAPWRAVHYVFDNVWMMLQDPVLL